MNMEGARGLIELVPTVQIKGTYFHSWSDTFAVSTSSIDRRNFIG